MPSDAVPDAGKKKKKVYYSARGGSRTKGADVTARANASYPSPTALETPLPRFTSTHFLRGGEGNEWNYVVEDGVLERALQLEQQRVQELRWETYNHRLAKTGLRGGGRIPKKKTDKPKSKPGPFSMLRRRKDSTATLQTGESLSAPSSPISSTFSLSSLGEKSLEQRLHELSIASSDDGQSAVLSNFTAPSFLLQEHDNYSEDSVVTESGIATVMEGRSRSHSLSSMTSEDSLWTPEGSPVHPRARFSFVSPGILIFKPDEARPLAFDNESAERSSLELDRSAFI